MSLLDEGFRFCSSPDRQEARWLHPNVKAHFHPDWIDVTEMSSDELLAFFTFQPMPAANGEQMALF